HPVLPAVFSPLPLPTRSTLFPYTTLFRSKLTGQSIPWTGGHPLAEPMEAPAHRGRRNGRASAARSRKPTSPPVREENVTAISDRSEEHTSELQSLTNLVCRLLLPKQKTHH